MIAALAMSAFAEENGYNAEPVFTVALTREVGDGGHWGVRAGGGLLLAMGDHCSWNEDDCRGSESAWAIGGGKIHVDWRGGNRFGGALDGVFGVAKTDMYQFGFFPMWAALAGVGPRIDVEHGFGIEGWLQGQRSLSYEHESRFVPGATSTTGPAFLQLTIEGGGVIGVDAPRSPWLGAGLQATLFAGSYS